MLNATLVTGKPTVIITGVAGFIGTNLAEELVKYNNVIGIDNFSTGNEKNIDQLLQNPNFEFIRHDITDPLDLEKFPELKKFQLSVQGIQEIYHLACPTSPRDHEKFAIEILGATSYGTKNILDIALKYRATFIHVSSQHVYGEVIGKESISEKDMGRVDPIGHNAAYDEGKRYSETLVSYYQRQFKLDARIARLFTTYGPKMATNDGRSVPDFIVNSIQGKEITIYGNEQTENTFCYIADVIDGLIKLAKSEYTKPVNIGHYEKHNLKNLAEMVKKLTESSSTVALKDPDWYLFSYNIPDITTAKERLGWFPLVGIEEGLIKTIEWTRANLRTYQV